MGKERQRRDAIAQQEAEDLARLQEKRRKSEKEASDIDTAREFLQANGYSDINGRRNGRCCCRGGESPIHTAVTQQNARMVECLIFCNADVSKRNSKGLTAQG